MKHIRAIKRRDALVLNTLFLASAFLFYETYSALFFKELVQRQLEKSLPEGTRVDIGSIKDGIFRNLILEDVSVFSQRQDLPSFNVERIEIDYRLWYPLLKKMPALKRIRASARFYDEGKIRLLVGKKEKDFVNGFFELKRKEKLLDVAGYLLFGKNDGIFIKGTIDGEKPSSFRINQKKGFVDLKIGKDNRTFTVNSRINHINPIRWLAIDMGKFQDVDFIGECNATINIDNSGFIDSHIIFKNLIVNYKPFDKDIEIFLSYDKAKKMLNVNKFKIGGEIEGYGYVRSEPPYLAFLNWQVSNLALEDYFTAGILEGSVSGTMNGNFALRGPIKEAHLSAHLDVQSGNLGYMRFDSIIANLKGKGPLISIYDSRIYKEGGYITIGGEINLAMLKDKKAFDTVFIDMDKDFFVWEGWNVIKGSEDQMVKAEKLLGSRFKLSFKTFMKGTMSDMKGAIAEKKDAKTGKVDLEYRLDKSGSVQMTLGEKEEFIGIGHKVRF